MTNRSEEIEETPAADKSKSRRQRTFVSIVILAAVLVVLLWYMNPDNIIVAFSRISNNPYPIVLFFVLFAVAFVFRSLRWHLILGSSTSIRVLFRISLVTWFVNAVTPARLGDVTSIYLFYVEQEIPVTRGLLLVVIDRIMDVLSLLFFFIILLNVVIRASSLGNIAYFFLVFSIVVVLISVLFLSLIVTNPIRLQGMIEKLLGNISSKLTNVLISGIHKSNEELAKLTSEKRKLLLAFLLAFPTWFLECTSTFLVAKALGIELDLATAFVAVMVGFFSMTVPLTIGGFGSFELAIATSLVILHSIDDKTALLIAFLDHVFRQVFVLGAGFVSLGTFRHRIDEIFGKFSLKN